MDENPPEKDICRKCLHFFITWDPRFPNGCRAIGFKSKNLPCLDVFANSGMKCRVFEEKKKENPGRGAGAGKVRKLF